MDIIEYRIIIEFNYSSVDDALFFELMQKLHQRMDTKDAPGKYEGHEIAKC